MGNAITTEQAERLLQLAEHVDRAAVALGRALEDGHSGHESDAHDAAWLDLRDYVDQLTA